MYKSFFASLIVSAAVLASTQASAADTRLTIINKNTYSVSGSSKCADGSTAVRKNGSYWCKVQLGQQITYKTRTYTKFNKNTCPNGTSALRYMAGWWCLVSQSAGTPTSYTAKLNWTPPSTREDGSPLPLSELKGYEIYYTSDDLSQSVSVPVSGASVTSHSVGNLKAGTYHFAISAIDSKGAKSKLSSMVSTTFR